MKKKIKWIGLLCALNAFFGCIEEFEAETVTELQSTALVVDARVTDQNVQQTIYLSRLFPFEAADPTPEPNAQVSIVDDLDNVFGFQEVAPGRYITASAVQFVHDRAYRLVIQTTDGSRYSSEAEMLPTVVPIGEMKAIRRVNSAGTEGVAITLDNNDATGVPNFFRFEYEETFKIVAPHFNPFDWDEVDDDYFMNDDDGWEVTIAAREEPALECFASNTSNALVLGSTERLGSNNLDDFEVRFLGKDNYAIAHRYSILVKQYHHSVNAASFYESLSNFSNVESVFSNVQTGRLETNIRDENSSENIVLGYFELSSYSEKRMFFNYSDLFPNEPLPPYVINCDPVGKPPLYPPGFHVTEIDGELVLDGNDSSPLIEGIKAGLYGYHAENENFGKIDGDGEPDRAPFLVKSLGCVDCRKFGSNVKPDFWINE
ncbi:DUF4249 domain-containing protein [uncultured Croceitalea sp.]|uniref:DUF4249 domain-containing protein n=1 Tax=uncultured Croceitalea sp. TaxID=1798908 RepID=UPI003305F9BB